MPVGVGRMRDAAHRVTALAREVQAERPVRVGRERHAARRPATRSPRALCSAMKRAVCSSTSPAPASCVSRTCDSMLSSRPSTPTMPPCAQAVAPSSSSRLASTTTGVLCGQVQCHRQARQPGADDDDRAIGQEFRWWAMSAWHRRRRRTDGDELEAGKRPILSAALCSSYAPRYDPGSAGSPTEHARLHEFRQPSGFRPLCNPARSARRRRARRVAAGTTAERVMRRDRRVPTRRGRRAAPSVRQRRNRPTSPRGGRQRA